MTEAPGGEGEQLVQRLHRAATATLSEPAMKAGSLGGWHSGEWIVLRTLALMDTATAKQLREHLDDYQRVYASPDAITAALARHARETLHVWPSFGYIIETTLTLSRRAGLVTVDWHGRGRNWLWSITTEGRALFNHS